MRTSWRATRISKRGFTLVELTVVITILVLFAIAIMPNLLNQKRSGDIHAFYSAARRVASEARERAVTGKQPVFLTYDEAGARLVVSAQEPDSDQKTEVSHLAMPTDMRATSFKQDTNDATSADWSIGFYPDGTSDGGGIQLEVGNGRRSLVIAKNGSSTFVDGDIPDTSTERWTAGSYEQRQ